MTDTVRGTTTSADGTPIAWIRAGAGPRLVLVHGTDSASDRWRVIQSLLASQFTTCAVERRGRGRSGDGREYSLEREVEDVVAILNLEDAPVSLVGHSFGAICALQAALRTERIGKLVLYEPPINVRASDFELRARFIDRLQSMLDSGDPAGVVETFLKERVGKAATKEEVFSAAIPAGPKAETILRELRAIQDYSFQPERLETLKMPVLLLCGTESLPHLRAATEALHAALPRSAIAALPGQGHVAMDSAPRMFLARLLEFLT